MSDHIYNDDNAKSTQAPEAFKITITNPVLGQKELSHTLTTTEYNGDVTKLSEKLKELAYTKVELEGRMTSEDNPVQMGILGHEEDSRNCYSLWIYDNSDSFISASIKNYVKKDPVLDTTLSVAEHIKEFLQNAINRNEFTLPNENTISIQSAFPAEKGFTGV